MAERLILIVALYLLLFAAESRRPAETGQPLVERLRNVAVTAVLVVFGGSIARFIIPALAPPADPGHHTVVASAGIAVASLFVLDLIFYWYHRAQHTSAWLWSIHELHHSDAHLNATSSLRSFWLESPIQALVISIPVSFISHRDLRAALLMPTIGTIWLFFAHANWRLDLKWLTPIVVGPQLHRIHHSILPQHRDKNFAQFFPVIDMLFSTYLRPSASDFPPTGTPQLPTHVGVEAVLVRPFRIWLSGAGRGRQ